MNVQMRLIVALYMAPVKHVWWNEFQQCYCQYRLCGLHEQEALCMYTVGEATEFRPQ